MNMQEVATSILQKVDNLYEGTNKRIQYLKRRGEVWKALHIYGSECRKRGWELKPEAIWQDLMGIIVRLDINEINDLPSYLSAAIKRHIGMRAEELNLEAKRNRETPKVIERVIDGKKVVEIQESSVEWLDRACRTKKPPGLKKRENKQQLKLI